ncbi:MAG: hypothetical protein FJ038_02250 [Chloroflexi bacterium]|nr:hypothetical protein [Chloroflexota bacterium]
MLRAMYDYGSDFGVPALVEHYLTLVTDSHIVRGTLASRLNRMSDILNQTEHDFIVVRNASLEELGERGVAARAKFAQVNLNTLLFAVADTTVEPKPEMRLPKSPEDALIVLPPFKLLGRIHILAGSELYTALSEMTGRFIALTEASYWSDTAGVRPTTAPMVAFNHSRAHILAQLQEAEAPAATTGVREGIPLRREP